MATIDDSAILANPLGSFHTVATGLLPPAREFRWELTNEPPPLLYPQKPYRHVSMERKQVIDASGQLFSFTVQAGKITQWSNQFSVTPQLQPYHSWPLLEKKQHVRIRRKWELHQLRKLQRQLKAKRNYAVLTGIF